MAFSYGFFNAKNLDRTYTAENFCDYLGSIICNGIQDNYGGCFKPTASNLILEIASGKAWIDGHYFISDTAYAYDLAKYVDASLPRYVSIGICCNTGESYRKIEFETSVGTPATNPQIPIFTNTDTKTYLTLCTVKIEAGATELSVMDYRNNYSYCGYVRCILGKCKVTDMMSQIAEILEQIKYYNTDITALANKVEDLTVKVDEITGDVVEIGKCGEDANYVLYSDGKLIIKGSGAMYDYGNYISTNKSPFYSDIRIKSVIISEGITTVGEFAFNRCDNLKTAILPATLTSIKRSSFMPNIDQYVQHQTLYGLTTVTIPNNVTELGKFAFSGTAIQSVTIPASVVTVGEQVFAECQNLRNVRYSGNTITDRMFLRCTDLTDFTITKSCREIEGGCFNYCDALTALTYEGSISDWNSVTKHTGWDGHNSDILKSPLVKVQCLDGCMEWDAPNKQWIEVHTYD